MASAAQSRPALGLPLRFWGSPSQPHPVPALGPPAQSGDGRPEEGVPRPQASAAASLQAWPPCSCPSWWACTTTPSSPGSCGTSSTPSRSLCPGASARSTRTGQVSPCKQPRPSHMCLFSHGLTKLRSAVAETRAPRQQGIKKWQRQRKGLQSGGSFVGGVVEAEALGGKCGSPAGAVPTLRARGHQPGVQGCWEAAPYSPGRDVVSGLLPPAPCIPALLCTGGSVLPMWAPHCPLTLALPKPSCPGRERRGQTLYV